jgi:uncharacterized protein YwqG
MGIITKLFGGKGDEPPSPPPRDMRELVAPFSRPAAQLLKSPHETRSHFGGAPSLPAGQPWPSNGAVPLAFLACVDLKSLAERLVVPWMPSSGQLLFFYDTENQPWGFDPKHRGGWAVLLETERTAPAQSPTTATSFPRRSISFERIATLPSYERPEIIRLGLSDEESENLIDVTNNVYGGEPRHQIDGYPSPVQGDAMELECQLVSNGIYCGDSIGYNSARAASLRDGVGDWRLLLQIDSDGDLGVMWGDAGMLYFWIREADARARRFDRAWVVLQCH